MKTFKEHQADKKLLDKRTTGFVNSNHKALRNVLAKEKGERKESHGQSKGGYIHHLLNKKI